MKKTPILLMLLTAMTLITLNAAIPVKALEIPDPHTTRTIFAASPHTYDPKWNEWGVGELYMWNTADSLYVAYVMKWGDYKLVETHVAVAESLDDIPQTKSGNPKVGKFPYKMEHDPSVIEYTYVIPLDDIAADLEVGDALVIAAHAVILIDGCLEETAWADCDPLEEELFFPGANWATAVQHIITVPATYP